MLIMDVVFTLFNFSVLVGVFIYAAKQCRGIIAQEIIEEQQHRKKLVQHRVDLKGQVHICESNSSQQVDMCKDLARKVALWKSNFEERQRINEEQVELLRVSLSVRYEQQKILRASQRIESRVVPHALAQASLELYEQFHEEGQGAEYVDRVIKKIAKH